jgi:hypothetical protein
VLRTEYEFTLPCGYIDERGDIHRQGVMRRATALDEIAPLQDARVRANDSYISILLLSRVITRLGTMNSVSPMLVEQLFATDFVYLQDLYARVNDVGTGLVETECPTCRTRFMLDARGV